MTFTLTSPSFTDGTAIPPLYTCEGADRSPGLTWTGAPAGTKAFALIVDDPDAPDPAAPKMVWVHWVLYDIPGSASGIREAALRTHLPAGTREGTNNWNTTGFGGPCPPIGRHRYFFKVFALDAELGDIGTPTAAELEAAMKGHVLGQATLMGTYQKRRA